MNRFSTVFSFLLILLGSCAPSTTDREERTPPAHTAVSSDNPTPVSTPHDSIQKEEVTFVKNTVDSAVTLDYLMGKFDPAQHPEFVQISGAYTNRSGMLLHKKTYEAFRQMHEAAAKDGIKLTIISATRNFNAQKSIWEAKWTGERKIENGKDASKAYPDPVKRALKILEYSSMPGSSRHHWGTDIDLNNLNNSYFSEGRGLKEYEWLLRHGAAFGFCQPYTAGRSKGYQEEKWHWSYIPLAQRLTTQARLRLKDQLISGFKGAEVAEEIGIVKNYVLGINPACL